LLNSAVIHQVFAVYKTIELACVVFYINTALMFI